MPNKFAATWLPPTARVAINRVFGANIVYRGPFTSWDEARASSSGYDKDEIIQRIVNAAQRVLHGEARYEQDGTTFHDEPAASYALSGLLLATSRGSNRLSVLDFGGSLASHYLRWRPILDHVSDMHWSVVEQAGFVKEGRKLFAANPFVSFHEDIASISSQPNAILASSVLQYLPDPYSTVQRLISLRAEVIVLDRTPYGNNEVAVTQFVPASLGRASYPLWLFSKVKMHVLLSGDYELISEFDSSDQPIYVSGVHAKYQGSIWLRRT